VRGQTFLQQPGCQPDRGLRCSSPCGGLIRSTLEQSHHFGATPVTPEQQPVQGPKSLLAPLIPGGRDLVGQTRLQPRLDHGLPAADRPRPIPLVSVVLPPRVGFALPARREHEPGWWADQRADPVSLPSGVGRCSTAAKTPEPGEAAPPPSGRKLAIRSFGMLGGVEAGIGIRPEAAFSKLWRSGTGGRSPSRAV